MNNKMLIRKPVILPSSEKLLTNPSGQTHPLVTNQTLTLVAWMVSGDICFKKGVSGKAANVISNSRRQSSLSGYKSSWNKQSGWCDQGAVNPFRCTLVSIQDYLTSLFEEDIGYNTIGMHKSAISAYHEKVHDMPVGQHPLVTSLMAEIFNSRPPQPRLCLCLGCSSYFKLC